MHRLLFLLALLLTSFFPTTKARAGPEFSINYGQPTNLLELKHTRMNKEEKTGLFETFLELKSPGHRIFPYVSYATWENRYSQSGSSEIALGGIGIRSSKHPQVSDLYVQGNVGAGLIFGKNQERFAGGNHMFQVKVAAIYQLNRHLSVRAGLTHYSNGNILIQGNKRDIARNFFTVGMGYQF